MSMMSGFDDNMSIDSRPDSNYNFEDKPTTNTGDTKEESKDIDLDAVEIPTKKTIGQIRRRLTAGAKRQPNALQEAAKQEVINPIKEEGSDDEKADISDINDINNQLEQIEG